MLGEIVRAEIHNAVERGILFKICVFQHEMGQHNTHCDIYAADKPHFSVFGSITVKGMDFSEQLAQLIGLVCQNDIFVRNAFGNFIRKSAKNFR